MIIGRHTKTTLCFVILATVTSFSPASLSRPSLFASSLSVDVRHGHHSHLPPPPKSGRLGSSLDAIAVPATRGGADDSGATIPNEVFNLVKNIVGAGVLSLPAGVAAFGNAPSAVIPATILIAAIGAMSGYCFSLIGRVCEMTGECFLLWVLMERRERREMSERSKRHLLARPCVTQTTTSNLLT